MRSPNRCPDRAYEGESHELNPDVASVPANATVTAWLNQPFESAPRVGAPPVTVGAVLSILKMGCELAVPPGPDAVQLSELLTPSVVSVTMSQPLDEVTVPVMSKRTVMLVTYQPFAPAVPIVTTGVIVGADSAEIGAGRATAMARAPSRTATGLSAPTVYTFTSSRRIRNTSPRKLPLETSSIRSASAAGNMKRSRESAVNGGGGA